MKTNGSADAKFINNLIPRLGARLRMLLPRGPIEYFFHFIGVGNGSEGFKNKNVNRPFEILANMFLLEGVTFAISMVFN